MMPTFALTPAAAVEGPLDFTKAEHSKIYKAGVWLVTDTPLTATLKVCSNSWLRES
jgi:hypothetical protein